MARTRARAPLKRRRAVGPEGLNVGGSWAQVQPGVVTKMIVAQHLAVAVFASPAA